MNYNRDVSMRPSWIQNNRILLKTGTLNVTFTAKHPISKLISSCTTEISVIRKSMHRTRLEGAINFNLTFCFFCRIQTVNRRRLTSVPNRKNSKLRIITIALKLFGSIRSFPTMFESPKFPKQM